MLDIKKEFIQEVNKRGYEDEKYYIEEFDNYISQIQFALGKILPNETPEDKMYIIMNTIDYFMEENSKN